MRSGAREPHCVQGLSSTEPGGHVEQPVGVEASGPHEPVEPIDQLVAVDAAAVGQLVELVDRLASEVRELRAELASGRAGSPWMTSDEAAAWLKILRDTLDKFAASHGHEPGGP